MAPSELQLAYEETLAQASETIARALFGAAKPTEYALRTPKQTIDLPAAIADDLVRDLALISVAPTRPAHVWRSPQPDASELTANLYGGWGTSPLDPDPLPPDLLEPNNPLDTPDVLEQALDHLERLRDLAERHIPEQSQPVLAALTEVRSHFLDAFPHEPSNIGRPRSRRRGAWIREAADLLRRAIKASPAASGPPNADELGHLLAHLLDALSPEADPVADPTSIARVLRKPS